MPSGGARKGAGRPAGREPTMAIRLPVSVITALAERNPFQLLPLYLSKVSAGAPAPAEDDIADKVDIHHYLVKHPAATFLVRANGESMLNAGIHDNDLLVVDRSLAPTNGKIVIAAVDGELTVKRLQKSANGHITLLAENPAYQSIEIQEGSEIHIWGVVTNVIHSV
jgi:DNA polymerase V